MSAGVAFWTAGISCLYFSFLHLFQLYAQADFLFVVTVFCVWLSVYMAGSFQKVGKIFGFLLLILPVIVAGELFSGTGTFIISILPPILYAFYIIVAKKCEAIYWENKQLFKVSALVLGIELFASLVMGKEMAIILVYLFAYLLFAFMALNIFRFGTGIDKKAKFLYALNLGLYMVISGACAAVISFASKNGSKIIEAILMPFAMIFAAIVSLGSGLTQMLGGDTEQLTEETEKIEAQITQNHETAIEQTISNDVSGEVLDGVFKVVLVAALILLLVYILYRLYDYYKGRYVHTEDLSEMSGTTEVIGRKGFGKRNLFKTNRDKIRKAYVKHMRAVRGQGYRISKSSTSLDICTEAKARLNNEDLTEERIRELYMKARYSKEEITDEEVREMRRLV